MTRAGFATGAEEDAAATRFAQRLLHLSKLNPTTQITLPKVLLV
jgi:hypothetical protein